MLLVPPPTPAVFRLQALRLRGGLFLFGPVTPLPPPHLRKQTTSTSPYSRPGSFGESPSGPTVVTITNFPLAGF
jgi:hypothetical protein